MNIMKNENVNQYIKELKNLYENLPKEIINALIEADYKRMYGSRAHEFISRSNQDYYDLFEDAVYGLGKIKKRNILNKELKWIAFKEHEKLLTSGLFFEFFPNLQGDWIKDKEDFTNFVIKRDSKYFPLILNEVYED